MESKGIVIRALRLSPPLCQCLCVGTLNPLYREKLNLRQDVPCHTSAHRIESGLEPDFPDVMASTSPPPAMASSLIASKTYISFQ